MQKIFKLKSFWAVFLLSSLLLCAAGFNLNQTFESKTTFLMIPKTGVSAIAADQIVENLKEFPRSELFFDQVSKNNPLIFGMGTEKMTSQEKKDFWEKKIRTERIGESGFVAITIFDYEKIKAEEIANAVNKNLVEFSGMFYNTKGDIDIRVVDAAKTHAALAFPFWVLILVGFCFGFMLALFSFFVSFSIFENNYLSSARLEFSPVAPSKKNSEFFRWPNKLTSPNNRMEEEAVWPIEKKAFPKENKKDEAVFLGRKAAAPSNLPVAPEEDNSQKTKEIKFEKKEEKEEKLEKTVPIIKEATPEEVKERLNKLLGGKL